MDITTTLQSFMSNGVLPTVLLILRIIVPLAALYVVWRCYTSFRKGQRRRAPVIMLANHEARTKYPVLYWENSIGRDKSCDIILSDPAASRDHAVFFRRDEGWFVCDTDSTAGVFVNNKRIDGKTRVKIGDEMTFGSTTLMLMKAKEESSRRRKMFRGFTQNAVSPFRLMLTASFALLLMTLQLCFATNVFTHTPLLYFGFLLFAGWALYIYSIGILRRVSFEIETVAFLLSGIGTLLLLSYDMKNETAIAVTQLITMVAGMVIFCFMIWFMGDFDRLEKFRLYIGLAAVLFFVINLIFGKNINGSRNWIFLGGFSIQPSEFIKIAFIFFGAAALERLQTKRNMREFLIFTGICMLCLFIIKDFGTALIYFACFLIIAFMRSGSIRTIALILFAILLAILFVLFFVPNIADHVMDRFSGWGHIWDYPNDSGYQQTRMLIYLASGGFFGVGLGKGFFSGSFSGVNPVFGSENDAIFGTLCEEQGLALGIVVIIALILFIFYSRSDVTRSRSTFYSIVSCAAAGLLLFQAALNILGSTDILPFTGVTLPFISAGGSSMVSVWGMMAFLKVSDERTYAVKRMSRKDVKIERAARRERFLNQDTDPAHDAGLNRRDRFDSGYLDNEVRRDLQSNLQAEFPEDT